MTTDSSSTVFELMRNYKNHLLKNDPVPSPSAPAPEASVVAPSGSGPLPSMVNSNMGVTGSSTTSPFVVDLADPNAQLSDWMSISAVAFTNPKKYPPMKGENDEAIEIKFGAEKHRLNEQHVQAMAQGSVLPFNFWFKIRGAYMYYFATKEDINVVGSVLVQRAEYSLTKNIYLNNTDTCFQVFDNNEDKYEICALTLEIKMKWLCSLQSLLKQPMDSACNPNERLNAKVVNNAIEIKKITQPLIIIPIASKECNDKVTYINKGKDWECICAEGREQSPINLPSKEEATLSSLRPMFQYDIVSAKATETTVDGVMVAGEYIKIRFERGTIRIHHPNMGKIVALDGGVFIAEEIIFHTPSEHTINGETLDMEMQIIHYGKSKGDIAKQIIVSFLFKSQPGIYNKFLDRLDFFNLPNPVDTFRDITNDFYIPNIFYTTDDDDVSSLRPFSFYSYQGSLTSPPCTERTTHYVAADPIQLSSTVIQLFKEAIRTPDMTDEKGDLLSSPDADVTSNRDVQPLNGRQVFIYDIDKFNCPQFEKPKRNFKPAGHYEKRDIIATQFVFVKGDTPSGLPDSFVVSEDEAKGLGDVNPLSGEASTGDQATNGNKI